MDLGVSEKVAPILESVRNFINDEGKRDGRWGDGRARTLGDEGAAP